MIDLTIHTDELFSSEDQVYQEGINSTIRDNTGIDAKDIGDSWSDISGIKDVGHAIKVTNDKGIQPARDIADVIDKHVYKDAIVDNRSIVARARNSILQFPVYVTQSCPVAPARIISDFFARYYTSMVQETLAQNPVMDEEEANNLVFLKKYHVNLKESVENLLEGYQNLVNPFYQPIDEIDALLKESVYCEYTLNKNCKLICRVVPSTDPDLLAECARGIHEPLEGFDYLREGMYDGVDPKERTIEITSRFDTVDEDEIRQMAIDKLNLTSDERQFLDMTAREIQDYVNARMPDSSGNDQTARENQVRAIMTRRADNERRVQERIKRIQKQIKSGKKKGYSYDGVRYRRNSNTSKRIDSHNTHKHPVDDAVEAPHILKDTEVKRINSMLPYTIEATFRLKTKNGIDRDVKYILGVKCVLHIVRTNDLAEDLQELITGKMKALQKVRYKTGEISFRDYLFNDKQLKADAAKNINYNKRWLNNLKRLADYRQQYGSFLKIPIQALNKGDVPIPNATLILTQPDIAQLTSQTGIDLSQIGNARRLTKNLFLAAICIIDASAGTMRVYFDEDTDWDIQSLQSIDQEVARTDNSQLMRELNRVVNR